MKSYNKDYKDVILAEAKDIAMHQGITGINIRSVAKKSGIAIGTIYNYFPSKGDLLAAVIKDFWEDAFTDIDWKGFTYNNFYDNLKKVYSILYLYLNKFKENWLEQLSYLKAQEKSIGIQKQNEYFQMICDRIKVLIDMDDDLRQYPWSKIISKENIAKFIFDNFLISLKRGDENIDFLLKILQRILSN